MERWTPSIVVAIPILAALVDVLLYVLWGNDATISVAMLRARARNPLVIFTTCWTFGVFVGHVYYPTFTLEPPPAYEVIARLCVVLSPCVYSLIIIRFGGEASDLHMMALQKGGDWKLVIIANACFLIGQLAGKYALAQHLKPVGVTL